MNRSFVSSSNILSVGYDEQAETLEIEFNSGGIYQYFNVPEDTYSQFVAAPSKGQYFHIYIKNFYPFSRVG